MHTLKVYTKPTDYYKKYVDHMIRSNAQIISIGYLLFNYILVLITTKLIVAKYLFFNVHNNL